MNEAVQIGKTQYRVEYHEDSFYGKYWAAFNLVTGRPHAMRESQQEAVKDLDSMIKAQAAWENL